MTSAENRMHTTLLNEMLVLVLLLAPLFSHFIDAVEYINAQAARPHLQCFQIKYCFAFQISLVWIVSRLHKVSLLPQTIDQTDCLISAAYGTQGCMGGHMVAVPLLNVSCCSSSPAFWPMN